VNEILFAISLNTDQTLHFQIGTTEYDSYSIIPFSEWSLFTTTFHCYYYYSFCTALTFKNEIFIFRSTMYLDLSEVTSFKSSDMVLLGGPNGFKGKIVSFRIFNPGYQRIINRKNFSCEIIS